MAHILIYKEHNTLTHSNRIPPSAESEEAHKYQFKESVIPVPPWSSKLL